MNEDKKTLFVFCKTYVQYKNFLYYNKTLNVLRDIKRLHRADQLRGTTNPEVVFLECCYEHENYKEICDILITRMRALSDGGEI